ncbi:MAG: triose-phosphate isomerase [Clostridia bacterium]|nr:triose-phosphate isomerase [Clostridia bacterium]
MIYSLSSLHSLNSLINLHPVSTQPISCQKGLDVAYLKRRSPIIQYGGSMNEKNAADLLAKENVDGGLIGGASLVTDKFTAIVSAANA